MMVDAGVGTADDIARAKTESLGFRVFIRSLVGLDREAAKQAFGQFLSGGTASANQVEFVSLIVDYLTEHGVMEAARLYESPFTDVSPRGPEGVFSAGQVDELVSVLAEIRERAA
jgi:type I restriction enzyme R subunit